MSRPTLHLPTNQPPTLLIGQTPRDLPTGYSYTATHQICHSSQPSIHLAAAAATAINPHQPPHHRSPHHHPRASPAPPPAAPHPPPPRSLIVAVGPPNNGITANKRKKKTTTSSTRPSSCAPSRRGRRGCCCHPRRCRRPSGGGKRNSARSSRRRSGATSRRRYGRSGGFDDFPHKLKLPCCLFPFPRLFLGFPHFIVGMEIRRELHDRKDTTRYDTIITKNAKKKRIALVIHFPFNYFSTLVGNHHNSYAHLPYFAALPVGIWKNTAGWPCWNARSTLKKPLRSN